MTKRLRITYLFDSTTLWGGNKVALEQAEVLSSAGHRVNILSKDKGPTWYPLKLPVVQVSCFDSTTIPESDIVVGTYWPTVKAAYESDRGTAVHLCQGYEGAFKELRTFKEAIDEVYSYRIPKLTVSSHMNAFLAERFNAETYYIGQMINRDIFYPDRTFIKRDPASLNVLVIGPFEADVKNIGAALRGISAAREKLKIPMKLIRVSQLPLTDAEKTIINPDEYHLLVPYRSMGAIYRDADILISMSKEAEGFGLPAIEAMACGVPTILSRIPSYLCLDEIHDYAFFVEHSDSVALAEALTTIYRDKPLRERLIRRGFSIVEKFTQEKVVDRLEATFDAIRRRYISGSSTRY
jgi:glycosyltransferase involved in cell wall biosynthesis